MKLLPAIAASVGILLSSGAFATPLCNTFATLTDLAGGGAQCVDNLDQDLLLTFNSTTLPSDTTFELVEAESAGLDFYAVNLSFPGGFSPTVAATFDYTLTVLPTDPAEFLDAANFDTVVQGSGFVATKQLFDANAIPILTLTSTNGSRDPAQGETPFPNQTFVHVLDTYNPGTGIYTSSSNSFDVRETVRVPEPATLALIGVGLLGMALRRKRAS